VQSRFCGCAAGPFLDGDVPAGDKVRAFLARALEATGGAAHQDAAALFPWICDALPSNHSVKAYGRDFPDFVRHMQARGIAPPEVTADHVKLCKRGLLEAGITRRRWPGGSPCYAAPTSKEDADVADRRIQIRLTGPRGQ